MNKVFLFGIDGASYKIIENLISDGRLPTFKRLVQSGAMGKLKSTIPPHTAPGWVSAGTGVGPGKHGIYQFWDTQSPDYVGKFMGSKDWQLPPLWKILNSANIKTGIINVPMTHPPYPVDGYIITWPLSNTIRYSYPENLLSNIAIAGGHYLPDISIMCHGEKEYVEKAINITEKRVQTVKYLLNSYDCDFTMAVFPEVDRISHFYWHFWDEKSPEYCTDATQEEKEAITRIYEATDKALADIVSALPEDTMIMIISDHGFGVGELNFNVQTFLKDKGFLSTKEVETDNNYKTAIVDKESSNWFCYEENGNEYTVDWSKTIAYMAAPGSYGVNINLKERQKNGIVSKKEFEDIRTQVMQQLITVRHPVTNEPLFQKVLRSEAVYKGEYQKNAPDIILIPQNFGIMVNHNLVPGKWFSSPEQKGMHRQDGIFIASGPNVKSNYELETAKLEDILPTVLYYFGLPIPNYAEGEVLPIYSELIQSREHKTDTVIQSDNQDSYSKAEQTEIEGRLKALGYL